MLKTIQRDQKVLTKILRSAFWMLLALSQQGVVQAADMGISCKLKGGSLVQLSAEACQLEGGAQVDTASDQSAIVDTGNSTLTPAQMVIVDLLDKPVIDTTPLNRNPEGIERSAKFDGCKLMVDEILHIEHGNLFSSLKNFKINSVIDFQKVVRDQFGLLGEIASKGGDLKAVAVYFEERKRMEGNALSISVLESKNGGLVKYSSHVPAAYWDAPRDDLWIADEYGYPKDNGWGAMATDRIRILLIINSSSAAKNLISALEDVYVMCRPQPTGTN